MAYNTFERGKIIEGTYRGVHYRYQCDEESRMGSSCNYGVGTDMLTGEKVFLKKYNNPTTLVDWFDDFVAYQEELKKRIDNCPSIQDCVYKLKNFFVDEKDWYWQAVEFIDGAKDLDKYLQEPGTTWEQRKTFAKIFMHAMKVFHVKCKIVHADLKPANLLLIPQGDGYRVKLIDLDRPIFTDFRDIPWEEDDGHIGSPGYFSPEHLRGQRPTEKSDIFTCGIILHELLAKCGHPFDRQSDLAIYESSYDPNRVPELWGSFGSRELDERIARLLNRCLDPNPNNRPTAEELHAGLIARPSISDTIVWSDPGTISSRPMVARRPGMADIVFLIDTTGSMQPCINALKDEITNFLHLLEKGEDGILPVENWRARVVGYRDYEFDNHPECAWYGGWLVDNPFTSEPKEIVKQLKALRAIGGGQDPKESLQDALMLTINAGVLDSLDVPVNTTDNKKWRPGGVGHVIILITDAGFNEFSYPLYRGFTFRDVLNSIKQQRIAMYGIIPESEQYDSTYGRVPKASFSTCGSGADGMRAVLQERSKFIEILDRLRAGISISSEEMLAMPDR